MAVSDHPDRFHEEKSAYVVRGGDDHDLPDLERGAEVIRNVVKSLPLRAGVYRMLNARGDVLYVGKAKQLKRRVANYTQIGRLSQRIQRMVSQTRAMEIVTTVSEAEALLMEAQLIKHYRPPYNVLLRDDKSFPFILLRTDHPFARVQKHRGARRAKGRYYGPFASGGAVSQTLNALQKIFLLRSCTDSYFNNRSRPCLLYQIRRCSAPCVGRIGGEDYQALVRDAQDFLEGRSTAVQKRLGDAMLQAAEDLDFELAAVLRDRLKSLSFVQGSQTSHAEGVGDADIFALSARGGQLCIAGFFIRGGQNWGHRNFFPAHVADVPETEVLASFLMQFYEGVPPPKSILVDRLPEETELLAEALSETAGRKVDIAVPQRGNRKHLLDQAVRNASEGLDRRLAESSSQAKLGRELAELFDLDAPPSRIEIYDNSHIQGSHALGAMVVAGPEGWIKGAYRKFNIKRAETKPGDDFAMMREVFTRRFARAIEEDPDREKGEWPDLVLIDGGKGQVSAVSDVFAELGIDDIPYVGVAKGPDRNAGRETFYHPDGREFTLPPNNAVLFYIQRLRDEAHRFAIGAHRQKRAKAIGASPLDEVPGIGPARKKALLMHFGTARAVRSATLLDLQRAPGVSAGVAQAVYDFYHPEG